MFSVPGKFVYMMPTVFEYYVLGEAVGLNVQVYIILTVIGHGVPGRPLGGGGPSLQDTLHFTPFISLYLKKHVCPQNPEVESKDRGYLL